MSFNNAAFGLQAGLGGENRVAEGYQPQLIGGGAGSKGWSGMDGANERSMNRNVLRKAFGNRAIFPDVIESVPLITDLPFGGNGALTPFRRAMNAGDINTVNAGKYANTSSRLPAPNPLNGSMLSRIHARKDGVNTTGFALYSGNPRYVYDGSDYTRYKKLRSVNKTYNDLSFGGANNGSYVAWKRVKH